MVDEVFPYCMVDKLTASFVRTVLIIQYYFKYFSALRGEFDQGEGDLEIVCAGNERIVCHSCIVECQSKILRRSIVKTSHDGLHLQRAQLRYVEIKVSLANTRSSVGFLGFNRMFSVARNFPQFKCEKCWG